MLVASNLPLPDECIDLVVAFLHADLQALHALVLSSQKLFQRAAPVLYRSPFRLVDNCPQWTWDEKEKRYTALVALLLSSRRIDISSNTRNLLALNNTASPHQPLPTTVDYLRFFTHQYSVNLWRALINLRSADGPVLHGLDESKAIVDLQSDVALDLIQYRPQDIKVIGQPIARIKLLAPSIQDLQSLVRLELSEIPYGCKLEPVLEFIRVHDALHGTLREIKIKGTEDHSHHLEPTHTQLVRFVQAMRTPKVVDAIQWREAILVLDQIPVDCLQTLLLGLVDMPPQYIPASEYLAQCLDLEHVRMPVRDENLFRWAVEAQRARAKSMSSPLIRSASWSPSHSSTLPAPTKAIPLPWQLSHPPEWAVAEPHAMARIKQVDLCGEDRHLIPALRDAANAFRDSLEVLKGMSLALLMIKVCLTSSTLTWSWTMSNLRVIDLEGEVALAFEFSALRYCPRLITLRLSLPPYLYSTSEDDQILQEMTSRMSQICLASQLLDLELYGKWPLSDGLLTVISKVMTRLTRVYIVSCLGYSMEGVQALIQGLPKLEWLSISKWLCAWQPMKARLQTIRTQHPHLDLVEE